MKRAKKAQTAGPGEAQAGDFSTRLPGNSEKIKRLIAQLKKLAAATTPVLVSGELGTGHETVAELLHNAVPPASRPDSAVAVRWPRSRRGTPTTFRRA